MDASRVFSVTRASTGTGLDSSGSLGGHAMVRPLVDQLKRHSEIHWMRNPWLIHVYPDFFSSSNGRITHQLLFSCVSWEYSAFQEPWRF